jgi:hypothetical protein
MTDLTLSTGKKVKIDLNKMTITEFREIVELDGQELSTERSDEILGKTIGLKGKEVNQLPYPDFRKVSKAFWYEIKQLDKEDEEGDPDPN